MGNAAETQSGRRGEGKVMKTVVDVKAIVSYEGACIVIDNDRR